MRKALSFLALFFALGCLEADIGQSCEPPYILVGGECCLDGVCADEEADIIEAKGLGDIEAEKEGGQKGEDVDQALDDAVLYYRAFTENSIIHGGQNMVIQIMVDSKGGGHGRVWVRGINARGRDRLNIRRSNMFSPGVDHFNITYRTPSCTGCAGISPGEYEIVSELTMEGRTYYGNFTIEIRA